MLATLPPLCYWFLESPVKMVVAGGVAQAMMLPLIGFAALHLRHQHLPAEIRPSTATTVMLWVSTTVMFAFAAYYVLSRI